VVCVDDQFPRPLAKCYIHLPTKDNTYTVRAVFIGRGVMHPAGETTHGEIGLLLKELINGMDPRHKHKQELGFSSARFRPLRDANASADDEEELVRVRTAPKVAPLKEMSLPYSPSHQPRRKLSDYGRGLRSELPNPRAENLAPAQRPVSAIPRRAVCNNHDGKRMVTQTTNAHKALICNEL